MRLGKKSRCVYQISDNSWSLSHFRAVLQQFWLCSNTNCSSARPMSWECAGAVGEMVGQQECFGKCFVCANIHMHPRRVYNCIKVATVIHFNFCRCKCFSLIVVFARKNMNSVVSRATPSQLFCYVDLAADRIRMEHLFHRVYRTPSNAQSTSLFILYGEELPATAKHHF